ncbi:hypothetical protein VNI00_012616 [Paramarasmius palmivorus]|uniref:Uncharacterized protein n=1 Tax=Paramarasmius palmivorus TaxID=297713 RepID=A0AAW0C450_9AGAR
MSDTPANFGTTLSDGIQDISALLPLLGTEQVEGHVGSALEKGYLYAAASNLSLFGSLGAAKTAFATLMGTITHRRFYGGKWLDDAGFGTAGSVTSMVTVDKDTGLYGAEVKLRKLLEEQHIDDPNLVSGFEWSGWRRAKGGYDAGAAIEQWNRRGLRDGGYTILWYLSCIFSDILFCDVSELRSDMKGLYSRTGFQIRCAYKVALEPLISWNGLLTSTSMLCAILGITPYIYLASGDWSRPLSWTYPALRSFGSFICAVCIQLALQLRIHRITNTSLEWMKANHKDGVIEGTHGRKVEPLERRIREYLSPLSVEDAQEKPPVDVRKRLESLLAIDRTLVIYQLLIAAGMMMIVVGYVGCFSIVKNSDAQAGPYVWFAMEAFLSLLRMVLWGLNPTWDESTGLTMKLKLHESNDPYYPLITSPYDGTELGFAEKSSSPKPFTVFSEGEFFAAATSWIGPIQRLGANTVTLYYALLPVAHPDEVAAEFRYGHSAAMRKDLCITALLTDSSSFTFLCAGSTAPVAVFSSKLEMIPGPPAYCQVSLQDRIKQENAGFLQSQLFREVQVHAQELRSRLFRSEEKQNDLLLIWNLSSTPRNQEPRASTGLILASPELSDHDNKYLNLARLWNSVPQYLESQQCARRNTVAEARNGTLGLRGADPIVLETEIINIIECAILEVYLWERESTFVDRRRSKDDKLTSQLRPECLRAMNTRIIAQKDKAILRYEEHGWKEANESEPKLLMTELMKAWDHLHDVLRSLRSYVNIDDLGRRIQTICASIAQIGMESAGTPSSTTLIPNRFMELVPRTVSVIFDAEAHWGGDEPRGERLSHLWLLLAVTTVEPLAPCNRWSPYISFALGSTISSLALTYTPDIQNVCALQVEGDVLQRQYLQRAPHTQQNSSQQTQLTTLIFDSYPGSSSIETALTNHISKHPNILCLAGMWCHRPGEACETPYCKAIFANREMWKNSMGVGSDFAYRVGFEAHGMVIAARGDYILLAGTGRSLVFFYAPSLGELTVTLTVTLSGVLNRYPGRIELKGTLNSDSGGTRVTRTQAFPAFKDGGEPESVVFAFPDVQKGSGEIVIQESTAENVWHIHGLVGVQWKA